jgi:hypothetical protein
MQRYPVRATHRKKIDGASLEAICRTHFGEATREGESVTSRWGAIERLVAHAEGKELEVDLKMNPKVELAIAAETVQRYNAFLQEATGYTSKERAKRLRKSAGE